MTRPPLSGFKVLELGELVAGPFVGTLLGEFGADTVEVLKRELSYSDAECARLMREGVLGEPSRRVRKNEEP